MPISPQTPLDFLTVGHVTKDLVADGYTLGGSASYSPLTARACGLRAGMFTAFGSDISADSLKASIAVIQKPSASTTTFENIYTTHGRRQYLHQIAERLSAADIPQTLPPPRILHLGPMANEVDEEIALLFPNAFIGLTPQGWMRKRGIEDQVEYKDWTPAGFLIKRADAVVISVEDVYGNEDLISEYSRQFKILVVTEGYDGARVYWNSDVRHFRAPVVEVVDPTGAGDIFAAAFFARMEATRNPWEAAVFAVNIASSSVTRRGLLGVPQPEEVQSNLVDVLRGSSLP